MGTTTHFILTGFSLTGPVLIDCDTVIRAVEKAAELARTGYAHILISDGEGMQYTPCEFVRFFRL